MAIYVTKPTLKTTLDGVKTYIDTADALNAKSVSLNGGTKIYPSDGMITLPIDESGKVDGIKSITINGSSNNVTITDNVADLNLAGTSVLSVGGIYTTDLHIGKFYDQDDSGYYWKLFTYQMPTDSTKFFDINFTISASEFMGQLYGDFEFYVRNGTPYAYIKKLYSSSSSITADTFKYTVTTDTENNTTTFSIYKYFVNLDSGTPGDSFIYIVNNLIFNSESDYKLTFYSASFYSTPVEYTASKIVDNNYIFKELYVKEYTLTNPVSFVMLS